MNNNWAYNSNEYELFNLEKKQAITFSITQSVATVLKKQCANLKIEKRDVNTKKLKK